MVLKAFKDFSRFIRTFSKTWPTLALFDGSACQPGPLNTWAIAAIGCRRGFRVQSGQIEHRLGDNSWKAGQAGLIATSDTVQASLRQFLAECLPPEGTDAQDIPWPLQRGAWLYLGYEAASWFEPAVSKPLHPASTPDVLCVEPLAWLMLHQPSGRWRITGTDQDFNRELMQTLLNALSTPLPSFLEQSMTPAWQAGTLEASFSAEAFSVQVECLKQAITRGETYQANLSIGFQTDLTLQDHPIALLEALCTRNPSPFSGLIQTPEFTLISNSPERLVSVSPSGLIESRPIAGTRGRGDGFLSDEALGDRLRGNLKEQAEHKMLVDLIRNDLGRVATPGTVRVSELMTLERYSHVTHLVSNVVGQRASDCDAVDVIRAFFPGATITGCPKLRTMALLQDAEPVPRGFYTGSMGYICADTGALDLNILIRSVLLSDIARPASPPGTSRVYKASFHAGAGIVADSVAEHEYRECLRKAQVMFDVLGVKSS